MYDLFSVTVSVDGDFYESGLRNIGDGGGLDALTLRQRAEIDAGEAGADSALQSEITAEIDQRLVTTILDDHKGDAEPELRRCPQPLDCVHAGTVAQQRDDL